MNKKQEEKIIEYATLHSKDCCVHTGDCDFDVKRMECCENMRIISTILKEERGYHICDQCGATAKKVDWQEYKQIKKKYNLYG